MAYYLIHCCNKRFTYVKTYLIPTMLEQGIPADNIFVYRDYNEIGNLRAFVDSCNRLVTQCEKANISGVWHLQDDVIISEDFAKKTELYDNGIVCAFTCAYDKKPEEGYFQIFQGKMWYSFPCMRIPTNLLREFVDWANGNLWQSKYFRSLVKRNNSDDLVFKEWITDNYPDMTHLNLAPNLVNHVDKYLGGSICNKHRDKEQDTMSIFWEDKGELQKFMRFALDNKLNI